MTSIKPFYGWVLERCVEIDNYHPGFAGHILRATVERRHVIAAYLSVPKPMWRADSDTELGEFLSRASHPEILKAAFGSAPKGFRAALGRGGSQPYPPRHYRYLHSLMSSRSRPTVQRILPRLLRVNPTRLRIIRILPHDLHFAPLVMALRSPNAARDLTDLVALLAEAGADRSVMVKSLATVTDMEGVRKFAKRWAFRIALPDHPVPAIDGYRPIVETADLLKMSIQFRNCARNYLANSLEGRSAFAVVSNGEVESVVHLVRQKDHWCIDDFYARENMPPDRSLVERWTKFLASHNITARQFRRDSTHRWGSLRRIAGYVDYEEEVLA
jgi:hypothetical protein